MPIRPESGHTLIGDRMFEQLENRNLMTATIDYRGWVHVEGSNVNDVISISRSYDGALLVVRQEIPYGSTPAYSTFAMSSVAGVVVNAYDGNDTVQVSGSVGVQTRLNGGR